MNHRYKQNQNKPLITNSFIAKKRLGQNFLIDTEIQNRIVSSCDLHENDIVLEIGPGQGALTEKIARQVKSVIAIEKDRTLAKELQEKYHGSNIKVLCADFLKYSFDELEGDIKVIGNLPYNVATPIIERLLENRSLFTFVYITVQLEHAQRMVAKPASKSYGSLSCFVQFYSNTNILFKIGSQAFWPVPKVQSCFMKLEILKDARYRVENEALLFSIIKNAFSQRRKTIVNSLAGLVGKINIIDLLEKLNISPKLRAENITLKEYVAITNKLAQERVN
ncbi:MAG: ribosomal RNA small subunit methyltransferase A [Omnitrophica WOR_2 bacterium GWF2_38_59]|nr:MAG: ribosomal RNA small subunit methyltransferase A [Omnitrophica WOR_2 bacterium GWF2_38_59]OGX55846.1 MAG: ribosomal RNA small subunit methyltransferase A [Omnitrophica WOR_2 bacterium RIFOXYC2_FULL_38_12]OGX56925.1 MAG: ribosomal RNA small subunit methyltransferase A [Omnitrophica WOR_2 bacterium RIFOXYB2_FULL_38_16]HBG61824.1 ribosomal RNA small subunit methyltransferase A [Candidatus Omnitrophota bacterium]